MRKTLAAAVGGLALLGLGTPAHARPFSCSGVPSNPKAYFCIVDAKGGATPTLESEDVVIPEICPILDFCTDPITQPAPTPGVTVVPGWWLILWYDGNCYYVYAPGTVPAYSVAPNSNPANC